MNLRDATLMILIESAAHPGVAELAQSAYDRLTTDGEVDYHVLSDLVAEASGKGVLRAIQRKYSATAREAIFAPILREIDRQKPVPPRRTASARRDSDPQAAGRDICQVRCLRTLRTCKVTTAAPDSVYYYRQNYPYLFKRPSVALH
jgi:hypothetical protein